MSDLDQDRRASLLRIQSRSHNETTDSARAGFLWKRGSTFKRWVRRWYVVERGTLTYSQTPQEAAMREVDHAISGRICGAKPFGKAPSTKRGFLQAQSEGEEMFGMTVTGECGKSVVLYTTTEEERRDWLAFFKQAIQKGVYVTDLYDIEIDTPLGSGAFATVVRAEHKLDKAPYAVKIISRSAFQECANMLTKEVNILHMIGFHKHIACLKEVLHAPQRVYMVTEFCDGGELVDRVSHLNPMSEGTASRIVRQLCEALVHLHDQGVAHMDLKPENIVFKTKHAESPIKLIDFSLATFFTCRPSPAATPEFVAPEIVRDPHGVSENGVGGEVDMWAVGILLYFLLSGRTPFDDRSVQKILENVLVGHWRWRGKNWANVSSTAKNLIRQLLQAEPHRRLTARQMLAHPWVNGSMNLPAGKAVAAKEARGAKSAGLPDAAAPTTPQRRAPAMNTQSPITPDRDVVQARTSGQALLLADLRKKQANISPHARAIMNSISNTRQNQNYTPKSSPKIGPDELQKFSLRFRMRKALLEASKTPERLQELGAAGQPTGCSRSDSVPSELRQSLFPNSPADSPARGAQRAKADSPTGSWSIPVSSNAQ
eukprot:jgi/Tetstr1/437326/TSEL_002810.t1